MLGKRTRGGRGLLLLISVAQVSTVVDERLWQ